MTTETGDTTEATTEEQEPQSFAFSANAKQLQTVLRGVKKFLAGYDRPALSGVHVTLSEDHCTFEATDGYALYRVRVKRSDGHEPAPFYGRIDANDLEFMLAVIAAHRKENKYITEIKVTVRRENLQYPNTVRLVGDHLRAATEWRCLNATFLKNVVAALGDEEYVHVAIPKDGKAYSPVLFRRPITSDLDKDAVIVLMPMCVGYENDRRSE